MIVITFLVGLIALALGLFRLGFVVNFISRPVLAGFASASAIITTVSMLKVCDKGAGSWELGLGRATALCGAVACLHTFCQLSLPLARLHCEAKNPFVSALLHVLCNVCMAQHH